MLVRTCFAALTSREDNCFLKSLCVLQNTVKFHYGKCIACILSRLIVSVASVRNIRAQRGSAKRSAGSQDVFHLFARSKNAMPPRFVRSKKGFALLQVLDVTVFVGYETKTQAPRRDGAEGTGVLQSRRLRKMKTAIELFS